MDGLPQNGGTDMIGIPSGFKKCGYRITTAEITDVQGWTLAKGQCFFVLEMSIERPSGFPVNIAVDNGFEDDAMFPITAIDESYFLNQTKEEKENE
jgi:hypothetical protein